MILAYAATKKERNGLRKTLDAIPKQRLNTAIDTIIGEPFRWPYLPARRDKKVGELRACSSGPHLPTRPDLVSRRKGNHPVLRASCPP